MLGKLLKVSHVSRATYVPNYVDAVVKTGKDDVVQKLN